MITSIHNVISSGTGQRRCRVSGGQGAKLIRMAVDKIATCIEETCEAVDRVALVHLHPYGEGVWRTVALEDYSNPSTVYLLAWEEVEDTASGSRFCTMCQLSSR